MRISLDGQEIEAQQGDTIAAALLRAGVTTFTRSIKYHRPRGPFCLQGTCGQCLMRVDGVPSLPACRMPARDGAQCARQNAPLGAENDLFRAADFLFSEGLDHHHLFTGSRVLGRVALEIARRLAGLGELPAQPRPPGRGELREVRLAVIGAGPAGLAAAAVAAEQGARPLVVERAEAPGGAAPLGLDSEAPDAAWILERRNAIEAHGELLPASDCVGLYANDTDLEGNALMVVRRAQGLLVAGVERVIVATGGASQPLPFPGVDRPGVYAARGLLELHRRCGVRVGERIVVIGSEARELDQCAEALRRAGYEIVRKSAAAPRRALGDPVRAVDFDSGRVRCDAVAVALPPAPLHDLASSVGATARWDGNGFPVETDGDGRTAVSWLFAAGTVAGKPALESGRAAGRAACL